jgi:hypothetical protein
MSLPKLETPKYTVTIPSTKKSIEFRPYLVKEEKILMMAMESNDEKQMMLAVKDIIRACTFNKLNPDDLTTVDLEYVFLKLRAKSVGESTTVKLKCLTTDCDGTISMDINLDSIEPSSSNESAANRILLTDKIGMTLRPITIKALSRLNSLSGVDTANSRAERITQLIIASIESIFDDVTIHRAEDYSIEDLTNFVDSLSTSHLKQIQVYIESLPRLSKTVEYTCSKCRNKHKIDLTGLQSFFA